MNKVGHSRENVTSMLDWAAVLGSGGSMESAARGSCTGVLSYARSTDSEVPTNTAAGAWRGFSRFVPSPAFFEVGRCVLSNSVESAVARSVALIERMAMRSSRLLAKPQSTYRVGAQAMQ